MNKDEFNDLQDIEKIEKSIILSSPIRMTIILLLKDHNSITIKEIQTLLRETRGNLDYHIN